VTVPVTEQQVCYEVVDGVAWLTINRPEARNALNKAVRDGLFAGVHRFNADRAAKVLVLTGAGDADFCAAFQEAERIWEPVYTSQDAQEGPAAFRDKRAPAWKGC
jgi:enoyl-CoA hydratase/carnithine racemase